MTPSTTTLLTRWDLEPSLVLGLFLFTAAYFYAIGPLRCRHQLGPPVRRGQIMLFLISQVILVIALLSPIDYIGDRFLFSVHMIQHLLLASLWPPLILLATPDWLVRPLFRRSLLGPLALFATAPVVAIGLFNLDMDLWHLPALYDLTLTDSSIHIIEHLTFMAFGLINWWPVLSPLPEQRLSYPIQLLYLFADAMLLMAPSLVLTFSPVAFYTPYTLAPRLWGISALTDQSVGGLIMWYPGDLPYAVWLVIAFYRWFEGGGTRDEASWPKPPSARGVS